MQGGKKVTSTELEEFVQKTTATEIETEPNLNKAILVSLAAGSNASTTHFEWVVQEVPQDAATCIVLPCVGIAMI